MLRLSLIVFLFSASTVVSQSLTPEQIRGMVDERVSSLNPYAELLNDPDPSRSLAALQIMMETGDEALVRMALEFGLLSTDPVVRRTAFEAFLGNEPVLSIRFDGTEIEDGWYASTITANWSGTLSPEGIGYWRIAVGDFSPENQCFVTEARANECFITVNSDGVFFTPINMNGRGVLSQSGSIEGTANIQRVGLAVPFSIQLLD